MNTNLISARKASKLTQKELGELSGLSQQTISHLERNRRQGKISTLRLLAQVLKVDISELLPSTIVSHN